ncbi:MAG: hypothetical protein RRY53_04450, partial [Pseudoflavonifractor sp.]
VAVTTRPLYFYRQRAGSITSLGISERCFDFITTLRERADFYAVRHRPDLSSIAQLDLCCSAHYYWALARKSGQTALSERLRTEFKTVYPSVVKDRTLDTTIRWKLRMKYWCPALCEWGKGLLQNVRGKE